MIGLVEAEQVRRALEVHSEQAGKFAAWYGDADPYSSCFNYSRRRLDQLLERYLPSTDAGLRLLDVGCGTGHQLARWSASGYRVAGVDGSAEMLAHAQENNPGAELREADARELPFADAGFDRVTSIEVLRYLPDPRPAIEEMARVLRPGGLCLATAAPLLALNGYALVNRAAVALPVGSLTRLKQFFTTSGRLRRQFLEAGFSEVRVHGVYLGPLIWIERAAPRHLSRVLRRWEPLDERLADRPRLRELSNMFLVSAVRGPHT
jgi:ubiquinone/menaquinone biosynthesis C-methylase UbiE